MASVIPISIPTPTLEISRLPEHSDPNQLNQSRHTKTFGLSISEFVPAGRLVELSGHGATTLATSFVYSLQSQGESVAWVEHQDGSLYPPDLAQAGVDLQALPLILIPGDAKALAHAAEILLRSGSFGGLVLDLSLTQIRFGSRRYSRTFSRASVWQNRLAAITRKQATRVLVLTQTPKEAASLGPMIGIRAHVSLTRSPTGTGPFQAQTQVLKDKTGLHARLATSSHLAPPGL